MNQKPNTVRLSVKDHILAHSLRFQVYQFGADALAVKKLSGSILFNYPEIFREYGRQGLETQREKKLGFFNSKQQKKNSAKALAVPGILEIRSQAGKKGTKNKDMPGVTLEHRRENGKKKRSRKPCFSLCNTRSGFFIFKKSS